MAIKNTAYEYGSIAKILHWTTAVLFVAAYVSIYYHEWFAESEWENFVSIQLHFSLGITLVLLTLLRIVWRIMNQPPKPVLSTRSQHIASYLGHYALYIVMVLMPVSGYLSIANYLSTGKGNISYFLLFDLRYFEGIQFFNIAGLSLEKLEDLAGRIHSIFGAYIVGLLIIAHIFTALYHHYIKKDHTLSKMASTTRKDI